MASPLVTLVEDPTDARSWVPSPVDAEGLGHPPRAAHRGRRAAGLRPLHVDGLAAWARARPGQRCAGFKCTPTAGCRAVALTPGYRDAAALLAGVGDGVLVQEVSGLHSGVNPDLRRLRRPEPRACASGVARWPSRCASSPSPPPIQRLLHDLAAVGVRPHVAADERRRYGASS